MSKRDDALSLLEDKQIITVKPTLATLIGLNEAIGQNLLLNNSIEIFLQNFRTRFAHLRFDY